MSPRALSLLYLFSRACSHAAAPLERGDALALVQGSVRLEQLQAALAAVAEEPSVLEASTTPSPADLKARAGELEAAKLKAVEQEDYVLAKELKREIAVLLSGESVERLRQLKEAAVAEEDFDLARDLRSRILVLENASATPDLPAEVKAYYNTPQEQLPWGWRSARDPGSGLDYYWPVNDRTAVTWDKPAAPPAGMAVPTKPPPPPQFEVRSASGAWSKCYVEGNGTKPGTYNITIRTVAGTSMELLDIPGSVIRNITSNETLLSNDEFNRLRFSAMVKPQAGESWEVQTKSHAWVPCVVLGSGNETDTYDIKVPNAPLGHQDHKNVHIGILRQATKFADGANSTNASSTEKHA